MSTVPILLVEDDENDVFFFKRAVERAQISNPVVIVQDGREAIEYLSGSGQFSDRTLFPLPGLIVLDLNLPHRNGLEVLKWIRSNPSTQTTVSIILTSSSSERDLYEAYRLGANSYLIKPTHPDTGVELMQVFKVYWLMNNQFAPSDGHTRFPKNLP